MGERLSDRVGKLGLVLRSKVGKKMAIFGSQNTEKNELNETNEIPQDDLLHNIASVNARSGE